MPMTIAKTRIMGRWNCINLSRIFLDVDFLVPTFSVIVIDCFPVFPLFYYSHRGFALKIDSNTVTTKLDHKQVMQQT